MARINIAIGLVLIVLSFFVRVPLDGALGLVLNIVISLGLFIAGIALIANRNTPWRELRPRFTKGGWGTGR
jgi:hypothetical protein